MFIAWVNLSLIGAFYVTHTTRALQSHDLSGEGINCESHTYFLTTQGHGGPPSMRDQLNAGAISETARILKTIYIIHSHIHSNKANMKGWLWHQMIFGNLVGLKLPDICLTGEEKLRKKNSPTKLLTTEDRTRSRFLTGAHTTASSTAVDHPLRYWF